MALDSDDEERLISDPYGLTRSYLQSNYYSVTEEFESRYVEEDEYSFGERKETIHLASGDFEWFARESSDSLEVMAEKACQSQRTAIRRRLWAIRFIAIAKFVILWGAILPPWVVLQNQREREQNLTEGDMSYCTNLFEQTQEPNYNLQGCEYFAYSRSVFVIMSMLWFTGAFISSVVTFASSWRPHSRIFTDFAALAESILCAFSTIICMLIIMNISLMNEPFNWVLAVKPKRITVDPPYIYLTSRNETRDTSLEIMWSLLSFSFVLLILGIVWIVLKNQLPRYGLNLEEFCPKCCGGATKHTKHANRRKIMVWIADRLGMPTPPELEEGLEDLNTSQLGLSIAPARNLPVVPQQFNDRKNAHHIDKNYTSDHEMEDYGDNYRIRRHEEAQPEILDQPSIDPNSHSPSAQRAQRAGTATTVLEMMENLSTTMTALTQKIDAIESRVGDGTALLVMPNGENQWDAVKK